VLNGLLVTRKACNLCTAEDGVHIESTVRALHAWTANGDGQISFQPGEVIEVYDEVSADWWFGRVRTGAQAAGDGNNNSNDNISVRAGLFPASHVTPHAAVGDAAQEALAVQPPWQAVTNPESGLVYYWNTQTGLTQYDAPAATGALEAGVAQQAGAPSYLAQMAHTFEATVCPLCLLWLAPVVSACSCVCIRTFCL
jgi:hypothetical protein